MHTLQNSLNETDSNPRQFLFYVLDSNLLLPLGFPGIQGIQGIQGIHSCIMAVKHTFPGDSSTSLSTTGIFRPFSDVCQGMHRVFIWTQRPLNIRFRAITASPECEGRDKQPNSKQTKHRYKTAPPRNPGCVVLSTQRLSTQLNP